MNFAHLSDTHVLLKDSQKSEQFNASLLVDDGSSLRAAIEKAVRYPQKPDVFFLTGDLVHEGTAADYRLLKSILDEACEGIPYFFALGNHDRRVAFWEGFYGKEGKTDPYVTVNELDGLRIISLDTSPIDGNEIGEMPQEQLNFLKRVLEKPAAKGSVVLLHHPPFGNVLAGFESLCPIHQAFHDTVKGTDVKAVFSGHTHFVSVNSLDNIFYSTAASTAFSMDNTQPSGMHFIDACSYNLGRITKNGIYVGVETVGYQYQNLYSISKEEMEQLFVKAEK